MRFAVTILLTLFLALSVGCSKSPEEKLADHKARADDYLAQDKVDEGIIELRNALQIAPTDEQSWFQIGEAYLKKGNLQGAYQAFSKVAELNPQNLDAQVRLGNLFLLGNSPGESKLRAEAVLEDAPDRADAHLLLGKALLRENEVDAALGQFDEAIRLEPGNLDYQVVKATALLSLKRLQPAREVLDGVLGTDANHARGLLLLAQVADLQGDDGAAQGAFDRLLAAHGDKPGSWISYGNYWLTQKNVDKALEAFRKAGTVDAKGTLAWEKVAEVSLSRGDVESAREAVATILKRNPESLGAEYYQARILLIERQFEDAAQKLQKVVEERPEHAEAHYFLGMAYYGQKNLQQAKGELQRAVELNPRFGKAQMLLAQSYLDSRDFASVVTTTDQLMAGGRSHPEVLVIRATALLGQNKVAEARQLLETVVGLLPNHARAQERLGVCYLAERQPEKALAAFEKSLAANPGNLRSLVLITRVLVAQKKVDAAIDRVREQLEKSPDAAPVHVLLGRLYAGKGDKARARVELEKAIELAPDGVEAYMLLASLHEGPDAARAALADVTLAVERKPAYLQGWMIKGTLHDRLGEVALANAAYRKSLTLNDGFVPALNNLAWNLSEHGGNIDEALKFAEKAVEMAPDVAAVNDTLGWIYVKKGVYMKGASHLEIAVEELKDNPVVQFHLGRAYAGMEKTKEAAAALRTALKLSGDFVGADEARALLAKLEE